MNVPNYKDAKSREKKGVNILRDFSIEDDKKKIGNNKKYFIKTYGCQMNERDSESIGAILEEMGFSKVDDYEVADLILLNTCSIRENAHNKVFGMLGRIKHLKEANPNVIAGLCGCMAQEEVVVNDIMNKYKWLNFVFGTHNIHKLPTILSEALENQIQNIDVWSKEGDIVEGLPVKRDNNYKAWVNIMYGCDKFCTYCIVPYTRGKQRSRLKEDILSEVKDLINDGYKEITLLGQNVNAYGKDFENIEYHLEDLLVDVSKTGIERIKFITSHPWDFTDGMVDVIKNNKNINPFVHLPIQSGSNKILKLMGRKYTKEKYLELVKKIRENIPNCVITTDIIVAFPGETREDFEESLEMVNLCEFDAAFTFIYSKRAGTPAAKMECDISKEEKENRLRELNQVVNKYSLESNKKLINTVVPVLLESKSEKVGMLMGYTDTNKLINVKASDDYIGSVVDVKVTNVRTWSLDGELYE